MPQYVVAVGSGDTSDLARGPEDPITWVSTNRVAGRGWTRMTMFLFVARSLRSQGGLTVTVDNQDMHRWGPSAFVMPAGAGALPYLG